MYYMIMEFETVRSKLTASQISLFTSPLSPCHQLAHDRIHLLKTLQHFFPNIGVGERIRSGEDNLTKLIAPVVKMHQFQHFGQIASHQPRRVTTGAFRADAKGA